MLDALRGVALFGILLINITAFKAPGGPAVLEFDGGFLDQAVVWALVGVALREGQPFVVIVAASPLAFMFLLSLPGTGSLMRIGFPVNPPIVRRAVHPTKGNEL